MERGINTSAHTGFYAAKVHLHKLLPLPLLIGYATTVAYPYLAIGEPSADGGALAPFLMYMDI